MDKRVRLGSMQRAVAKHLVRSVSTIPHVTTMREVRIDTVLEAKTRLAGRFDHLTIFPFVIHAVARALERNPLLNASLDEPDIVYHSDLNIGIAVSIGSDLRVPVIKGVGTMTFDEIVTALQEMTHKARSNGLTVADFRDGTFTVTNSGSAGGEIFTPIINHPQSAILGIGRARRKPLLDVDGTIKPGSLMYLCLSYDHRLINGHQAVSFLVDVDSSLARANEIP